MTEKIINKNRKTKSWSNLKISLVFIVGIFLLFILYKATVNIIEFFTLDKSYGYFELTGPMNIPRRGGYDSVLLNDGRVLITGGEKFEKNKDGEILKSAEIYNPETNKFTLIGNMNVPRWSHASVLLNNGKVLITGGRYSEQWKASKTLKSAEIYDPKTNKFTLINDMNFERDSHSMTLLNDNKVLIIEDSFYSKTPSEIFDPMTVKFKVIQETNTYNPILTEDGNEVYGYRSSLDKNTLLVIGTDYKDNNAKGISIKTYNTSTKKLSVINYLNDLPVEDFGVIKLKNGKFLIVGGSKLFPAIIGMYNKNYKTARIYDAKTNKIIRINNLKMARSMPDLILLKNGDVLISDDYQWEIFRVKK